MQKQITPDVSSDVAPDLQVWRTSVLNILLTVTAIAALPALALVIVEAIRNPEQRSAALAYLIIEVFVATLAVFRRLDLRLRTWGFLLLGYATATLAFARGGLAGDGRVYLLVLPMIAFVLNGLCTGLIMTALSVSAFGGLALAAHLGWMADWLVCKENPLLLKDWGGGAAAFVLALAVLMTLQRQLSQFQRTTAAKNVHLYEESEGLRAFNESIVQGIQEGILLEDAKGEFTFANQKVEALLGYASQELIGQDWTAIVAPAGVEEGEQRAAGQAQSISGQYETVLVTKESQPVPVIVSAVPLFDNGRFNGVLSVLTDITERKQAEERVRKRNRELELLNRASQAFGSTLDLDQVLVTILEEVRYLLGVVASSVWLIDPTTGELDCTHATGPQGEIVRGWRLSPGEGIAGWVARNRKSLVVPDTQFDERYFKGVDEQTGLELHSVLAVLMQVKQHVVGVLQVADTEIDRFDEADLTLLESLAASAAIAIENARLYEAVQWELSERKRVERQAAQAERLAAMGHLAAVLAHEINNPLQAIRSNLELCTDFDLESDKQEECWDAIRHEIERLAQMTRRVLDFARPADDMHYPVSVALLTERTLTLLNRQLEHALVRVTTDVPADLPPVVVAPNQIVQVLLNLMINAVEAMSGGGHIHIAACAAGDVVRIDLTNDGPPIPVELIERVFDPFFTTKPEGAGLGLSINYSIIRQHGGTISAENLEDGQGVTFTIMLPGAHLAKDQEEII